MNEKLSLKWREFYSNLSCSISSMRTEDHLHDVTLVTDDNQQISAHKLVLSLSSDYFKSIFHNNTYPNMILCLEGVNNESLANCLDFMYHGELQLGQDEVKSFLNLCYRFKIKGLQNIDVHEEELDENEVIVDDKIVIENKDFKYKHTEKKESRIVANVNGNGGLKDLEQELNKHISVTENGFSCTSCGKVLKKSPD